MDESLSPGQRVFDRYGNAGQTAEGQREYYKDGQLVKKSPIPSSYYSPVSNIIRVGPEASQSNTTPASSEPEEPAQPSSCL